MQEKRGLIYLPYAFNLVMLVGGVLTLLSLIWGHWASFVPSRSFFKLIFLVETAIAALYCLRGAIPRDRLLLLIAGMGLWGAVNGLMNNGINRFTFSHLYGALMPLFAISFGHFLARQILAGKRLFSLRLLRGCTLATAGAIGFYFILHKLDALNYFGVSSSLHMLAPFFLAEGAILWFLGCVILGLMTGKRGILVALLLQAILYAFFAARQSQSQSQSQWNRFRRVFDNKLFLLGIFGGIILLAIHFDLLYRFKVVFDFDFNDNQKMYLATGARSFELQWLIKHLNQNPLMWLIGGGWGESFIIPERINAVRTYALHYVHFSPGYVMLVYGVPFTIALYGFFFHTFFQSLRYVGNPWVMISVTLFIMSFLGSLIFVDINFWVIFGLARGYIKGINKVPAVCEYVPTNLGR